MDNNYQNGAPQYNGGIPLRCNNCKNISIYRFCPVCGADLTQEFLMLSQSQQLNQQVQTPSASILVGQQILQVPLRQQPPQAYQINQPIQAAPHVAANTAWQYSPAVLPAQSHSRKSKSLIALSIIIGSLVLAMLLLFFMSQMSLRQGISGNGDLGGFNDNNTAQAPFAPNESSEYRYPGGVSADEFSALKNDMSYAHISSIIGGDGQLINQGENLSKRPFYTCVWPAEDNQTAVVYVTFTDDAVSDITLEGTL